MQDGSPGIHVSGDVAAGWRKWECKAQQVQRGHWEDTAPVYSLHSQSPWSWHADSYEECPLRQMHANPLPSVGSDGTFLACPPGSLVVSRDLIGGVALASTDTTIGGVLHWFALGHKHHLMDVALA